VAYDSSLLISLCGELLHVQRVNTYTIGKLSTMSVPFHSYLVLESNEAATLRVYRVTQL